MKKTTTTSSLCGERHFDYLVKGYVEHYHTERPHQAKGNLPLTGEWPGPTDEPPPDGRSCAGRGSAGY